MREGIEKRDALIAEGHATAARVVAEAEAQQRQQIGALEQERSASSADRGAPHLRARVPPEAGGYIEGQLQELETPNAADHRHASGAAAAAVRPASGGFTAPRQQRHASTSELPGFWRQLSRPSSQVTPGPPARGPGVSPSASRAIVSLAVVALRVYGADQLTKFLVAQQPDAGEPSRCSASSCSSLRQELGRRVLPRQRLHLDLLDRRVGRHRLHHRVRPPHPVAGLGRRCSGCCSAAPWATSPTGCSASPVRARATSSTSSRSGASRRSSTSPTSRRLEHGPVHHPVAARGAAWTAPGTRPSRPRTPCRKPKKA